MEQTKDGTWTGLLMALVVVMFSFGGTELIGITAGETEALVVRFPAPPMTLSGEFSCSTLARSA